MLRSAHFLQVAVVCLLGIAVVFVHSAGMAVRPEAPGAAGMAFEEGVGFFDSLIALLGPLWSRHTLYAAMAVTAMLLASRINVRQLFRARGVTNPLFIIVFVSLLLVGLTFVPGLGRSVNGASRWLFLGPRSWGLSFQPSELVKWVMVVAIAWWCARRRGVMHRPIHGLLPPILLIAVSCGLIIVEDLGTGALIGAVALCMLIAGGARLWQLSLALPPAAIALAGAIYHSPYRVARILSFLDPWADPEGSGYHPIQSMVAIAQGGLWGRGLGNGIQKFGYLPEDTTDFIFAIICEEMGIVGAGFVVALYLMIIWVGLGIVKDCRDTFARLVGLGVILTVGMQAVINIAVVTVVVPTKGIALPLISAGGTGWIMTGFALGLVAALDNANAFEAEDARELLDAELDTSPPAMAGGIPTLGTPTPAGG
jgi:cell division protein FtsW